MADVAAMPQFTLHAEFGAQKRRRKLGDKFLGGVRFRAKAGREFPLEAGLMSTPMPLMPIRHKTHNAEPSVMPRRSRFTRKTRANRRWHSA